MYSLLRQPVEDELTIQVPLPVLGDFCPSVVPQLQEVHRSTGGSSDTGTCPSTFPQIGDPCQPVGLYCKYDNELCLIAYQCSTSGQFEWAGDCPAIMGGAASTGGTAATGGSSSSTGGTRASGGTTSIGETTSTGGTTATGGNLPASGGTRAAGGTPSTGGVTSTAGNQGIGCTGSFEEIQSGTGLCIAKMVNVTGPASDAGSLVYRIDATEVTKGQYDAWLATNPELPTSTDANCSWITSYAEQGTDYTGTDSGHHPVVYVNWCDAYMYCLAVGKRLCGRIGGGSNTYTDNTDGTLSQWYRACSSAGTYTFPYGNTYQASYCNGYDYGAGTTVLVGSLPNCMTSAVGYSGVYDLSGNVFEWEDSCDSSGQSGYCRMRGGSFLYGPAIVLSCGLGSANVRYAANSGVGFRCCFP